MRHGAAEDQALSGRDDDRALTPSGRENVADVARKLVELGEAPRLIVTSPLARALQTAGVVAAVAQSSGRRLEVVIDRDLAPGGSGVDRVTSLLAQKEKHVMVVGHEPDLALLASLLVGEPLPVPLERAMVVGLLVTTNGGAMRFILDPKALTLSVDLRAR